MADNPGYLYVLINPSTEGLVKIGKTTKDPEERAKELSVATGVPSPFIVVYKAFFQDCTKAETFVHSLLDKKRVSTNKEFFRISTTEAIQAIMEAEKLINKLGIREDESSDLENNSSATPESPKEIWQDILDAADNYYYGMGDELQDYEEALNLYNQAAKIGCSRAYRKIGNMYRNGEGVKEDIKIALSFFKKGAEAGDALCWGDMADCYWILQEYN